IATHSVIIDATDRRIWVSAAPHTLGPYLALSLDELLSRSATETAAIDAASFPADPLFASGYESHVEKRRKLIAARDALAAGDLAVGLELERLLESLGRGLELSRLDELESDAAVRAREHADVPGVETRRLAEAGERLAPVLLLALDQAELAPQERVVGLELEA